MAKKRKSENSIEKKKNVIVTVLKWAGRILLALIAAAILFCVIVWVKVRPVYIESKEKVYTILADMGDGTFKRQSNTMVYDKDGNLLSKIGFENYKYVDIEEISAYIQSGYIDAEDRHFASHHGIDASRTAKAFFEYVKNHGKVDSSVSGGSTITQQVVKNNLLTQDRTVERKALEILLAIQLEKEYSKADIMEFYCNSNYYGNGCYGVEGASQYYFGKSAKDVTIGEAAMLVATSNSPNANNPVADYDLCLEKRNIVLQQMFEQGDITEDELAAAENESPQIVRKTDKNDVENYMVSFAVHNAALILMEEDGFDFLYDFDSEDEYKNYESRYETAYTAADSEIRGGGYEIYTSFDQGLQKKLQDSIDSTLSSETEKTKDGQYLLQSAGVCIDNGTGLVVAAVGGRGDNNMFNRAYQAKRQPGSSIKPLLDYGPAIDNGVVTPGTVYTDKEIEIAGYKPKNYGGGYSGSMKIREALARSINTIAVQCFNDTGAQTSLSYLSALKFSTLTYGDKFNTAAALGGLTEGVTVEDMARGYSTIANGGKMRDVTSVTKITSETDGDIYVRDPEEGNQVYDKAAAFMLTDMMEGTFKESYGTAHKADSSQVYAGKTGTTDQNRDAWFAGYSAYYTTVVWTGCDDPQEVDGMTGSGLPLSVWSDYMEKIHDGKEPKEIMEVPENVVLVRDSDIKKTEEQLHESNDETESNDEDTDNREDENDGINIEEKDITYSKDIYDSRPKGWDYLCTDLRRKVEENEEKRDEQKYETEAESAVKEFEGFQIESADDALALDENYNAVLAKINLVTDTDVRAGLMERAEYKYSLLSGDVSSAWQDAIEEQELARQQKTDITNQDAADKSYEEANAESSQAQESVIEAYIDYLNNRKIYQF